ncbi:MAG: GNAT family N-acetyltransferase [Desulfobulbaceae bacterium]|nr:GNAT family N-acetyltransferase [Desulfobulbaceae bacterium]
MLIRPIQPEDREIEQAFVRGLSSNSKYFRFFSVVKELSPKLLDRFTQVDYPCEMAFIATIQVEMVELEIGVARYAAGSTEGTAEFAVVIADDWQGRGIGRELLRHLFDVAEESGFARIEGTVLRVNKNMLRLCREVGFTVSQYPGDAGLVCISKDL